MIRIISVGRLSCQAAPEVVAELSDLVRGASRIELSSTSRSRINWA